MENVSSFGLLVGRIFIAHIFLVSGISKIFNFSQTAQHMASHNMHPVYMWLVVAILVEVAGSISLVAGFFTRVGAFFLILFMVLVTLIFHLNLGERLQMIMFMKNVAITGGLLMVLCTGPGKFSLDKRKR